MDMKRYVQKCKNAIAPYSWKFFFERKEVWKKLKDLSNKTELFHLVRWRFFARNRRTHT